MKKEPLDQAEFQLLVVRALRMILAFVVRGQGDPLTEFYKPDKVDGDLELAAMKLGQFDAKEKI